MRRWLIPLLLTLGLFTDWMMLNWLYQQLGFALTLFMVVAFIPWGLYLQFTQGARVRDQLFDAFRTGQRIPETAMEGIMVMVGGVMMIVPGVLSSLLGLAMVLSITRRALSPLVLKAITMMLPEVSHTTIGVGQAGVSGRAAGFGATGVGPDVVDANPHGAPRQGRPNPHGTPRQGRANPSGQPGASPREPRKSISAEVVRIERNDQNGQGR